MQLIGLFLMPCRIADLRHIQHAARLALRGHGGAEPNPLVGCVIVCPPPENRVIGWGYHRCCGGPHAERIALERAGARARGATAYVTLEPCAHHGRTPPCTGALIAAGISRVVIARADPNPLARGGAAELRAAGIQVNFIEIPRAAAVTDPFIHRIQTGLPWVTAKWAQTIDGKLALRPEDGRWISSPRSRRMVHRERGRVDAILTGIGTVLADDPLLTARDVRRRRIARRVVIDPHLKLPAHAKLVRSIGQAPLAIACLDVSLDAHPDHAAALRRAGAELLGFSREQREDRDEISLGDVLRELVRRYDATHVLVEAGPRILNSLFRQRLVNEAWVFTAPMLAGDSMPNGNLPALPLPSISNLSRHDLVSMHRRDGDIVARYRVRSS